MNRLALLLLMSGVLFAGAAAAHEASVTPLLQEKLDDLKNQEGLMLVVEYPPGVKSASHRHHAHTFVYVLAGSVVMQVMGGERKVLKAGETFYETPADVHTVSENASTTEPAKILVFMVKEQGAPATVPAP